MDISFSKYDIAEAEAAGVDGRAVQRAVRDHLDAYLATVPNQPAVLPTTIEQFIDKHPALADYRSVLDGQVALLLGEIKNDLRPSGVDLEGVGSFSAYDVVIVGAYGKRPEEVAQLTREARQRSEPRQRLRVGFRLGADPSGQAQAITGPRQARECVLAAVEHGADSVFFYNYSESPMTCLRWIKPAIAGI